MIAPVITFKLFSNISLNLINLAQPAAGASLVTACSPGLFHMALCTPCFKDYISCGLTQILVAGTLDASAAYIWIITTPMDAKYSDEVTTDTNGNFIIQVSSLPDGLLNPYAGEFTLTVVANDAYQCNSSTWNDTAYCDSYDCISFEVRNGDHVKNTLGCPCLEYFTDPRVTEDDDTRIIE